MISLLTAAVSEHMMEATANVKLLQGRREAEARTSFTDYLVKGFEAADRDGNSQLDKDEFIAWVSEPQTRLLLEKVGIVVHHEDLMAVFDILDWDHSGML